VPLPAPLPAYYDRDCDLDLVRDRRVAVVGYGSQGRTQALNLRDSGVREIRIGVREGKSAEAARADGFKVAPVGEVAGWAEVLALLTSDEAHRDLYRDEIAPNLRPGACLVFAHGLSVRFGLVEPAAGLDVVLVSPKGIGPRIRDLYVEGEGVFCLFGVHQDATGNARALGLSFAAALGCGRKGILETTFRDECESDLFGEQVVLCGGVPELVRGAFDTLVEAGYPPEVAWFECFYELKLVTDLMFQRGIAGAFEKISNTAEYGAYLTGPRVVGEAAHAAMQEVLREVRDGSFVRRFMADYDAGFPDLLARRRTQARHPIETAGRRLAEVAARAAED
jgi:ketol-acid reductoisomerase